MDIVASETDMSIAQQFLMKLGGKEIEHTFQIITEPKKLNTKTSNQVLHGTFAELAHSLEKLNKAGNGIFVCVNQTDGKERKAENITKVRAVFADFDEIGQGLPKLAVCGLSPQLVVESSLGKIHAYWLVSDCPLSEFKSIQQAIAAKLGSDKAVNDLPRVMRVPGFIHQKDPNNLFQTRIVEINANEAYSVDKIKAGLGLDLYPALKTTHSALYDNKFIKHSGIDRIKSALLAFPVEAVDDRDIWLRVAMCLHSDSPEHLALWLEWSKQSDKYDEPNAIYTWDSLGDKDSEITLASLFYDARKYGWIDDTRPSRFELTDEGVFFNGTDKKGEALAPEQVCSSLRVVGTACGSDKQDWGR
ncbi:MAG: PriCT-2 domain-containing protein, partial [Nitrosomonadales bacterium]|nr:PriCT-2 domain-containing protein [Nitrosomonadales bacterium]